MNALQQLAADVLRGQGDEPAIWFEGRWHGWAAVRSLAREVADLVDASGADPRMPVLYLARNVPETLAAFLGLVAAGRSVRTLYTFQASAVIAREIGKLAPAVVVGARRDLGGEVPAAIRACGAAAIALDAMAAVPLEGLERSQAEVPADIFREPTIEFQTSGTTGPPKRFPVTYDQAHRHFVEKLAPIVQNAKAPALLFMSLGNLSGMMSTLPALMRGQQMLLHDRFSLDAWRAYMRTYRPAHTGLQPAAMQMLMDVDAPADELSSLRSMIIGSAPLDPKVLRAFEARYGVPVLLAYGATEFLGTVASMTPELLAQWGERKFGSVGKAVPGAALRVVDAESGAVLPPGETGVLEVRSEATGPDWVRTSDLGAIDADGFLFIRGRADGAIIRGGFKLLPETIEQALLRHEAVAAAAVVGVPDHRLGEVPGAALEFRPGKAVPDRAQLEAHLREHLPATHVPVHWLFPDELPRTTSMKVDRGAVARLFADLRKLARNA